jgi:FAD/FMN-containing dehydrogenase
MTTPTPTRGIDSAALDSLRQSVSGNVVTPDSAEYEEVRKIWNGMIDRRPAAMVTVASTADVVAGVKFAAAMDVPLTVIGGGHNVAGNSLNDGGVVIDLRSFRGVEVDPQRKTCRVQGGATLGDIHPAVQAHGLAVPTGVVTETGIAGLTLGGGLGWITRKYGTSSDNLLRAEIVTADGSVIAASEDEHSDLFWAIRGGGACPGVVTSFEFRAYEVGPDVDVTLVILPIDQAKDALKMFREFGPKAPDELSMLAVLGPVPPMPEIEERFHHQDCLILIGGWIGAHEEGLRVTEPPRAFGTPIADLSGPVNYVELQSFFDADYPKGHRYYWKSRYVDGLPDEAIEFVVEMAKRRPSAESTVDVWQLGGATSRVDPAATAYSHRAAPFMFGIEANWADAADDAANIAWAREVFAGSERYAKDGGLYINFAGFGEEKEDLARKALGANYDRQQAVLAKYDPNGVFRASRHIRG